MSKALMVRLRNDYRYYRDTASNWTYFNPEMDRGFLGFEVDTGKFKIGDGSTNWNDLPYSANNAGETGDKGATGDRGAAGNPGYMSTNDYDGDLNAAILAIGSVPTTLYIDGVASLTDDVTVPSTLQLVVTVEGFIVQTGAYTLTINGPFETAGQAFSGFSAGQVTFGNGIEWVLPEWWGNNTIPGTTDMALPLTNALSALDVVSLVDTTYAIGSTITITGSKTIRGVDGGSQAYQHTTIYHLPTSTGELFNVTSDEEEGVCLKNFNITGGNGSFAIISSRSYVRYEYLHMEPYDGGGIQFLDSDKGSSSSTVNNVQWVSPKTANAYTGYEVDVNGGDVSFHRVTAIYGAIGFNIIKGETIILDQCSVAYQTKLYGYSNATQFNTAGIKLSGADEKSVNIHDCYIENCMNGIYVESALGLSICNNLFYDSGVGSKSFNGVGNSQIYLKDSTVQNVNISNNMIYDDAAGDISDTHYSIYFNDAVNVMLMNNIINCQGDYGANYNLTTSTTVFKLGNTQTVFAGTGQYDYDPSSLMNDLDIRNIVEDWIVPTFTNSWVNHGTEEVAGYMKDPFGFVHLKGCVKDGTTDMFTLPVGYRPSAQCGFSVPANGSFGFIFIATDGAVHFSVGDNTAVYLTGISFKV